MLKVGLGFSMLSDSYKAGVQSAREAVSKSGDPSFTIVFNTLDYDPQAVFKGVKEAVKDSRIIGATSKGIIVYDDIFLKGIGVLTVGGDGLNVKTFALEESKIDDIEKGEKTGEFLLESGIRRGTVIIFFANGFIDPYKMLLGLYNTMGPEFSYIGSGNEGNIRNQCAFKYTERGVNEGLLVAAVIEGIDISIALSHGFTVSGDPLVITETNKNRIVEIDGIPALDAYAKRLNKDSDINLLSHMFLHPLGFPNLSGDYIIRDPMDINPDKSISFPIEIPKGAVGYVMKGRINNLIKSSGDTARRAIQKVKDPQFALIIDCISRHSLMKKKFKMELEAIRNSMGADIPVLGMLSWGEIGSQDSAPMSHNKTTVVAVAGEKIEDMEEIRKDTNIQTLSADLSILHEIASLSYSGSFKRFSEDAIEKTIRLFGARRSALLEKTSGGYRLLSCWGFKNLDEILGMLDKENSRSITFYLGECGKYGALYLEKDKPIDDRERRIYAIFAKRLEDVFDTVEILRRRDTAEKNLRRLSLTDELTGIHNRRGFMMLARQHLRLSKRLKKRSILMYMDVDNMKWINDNLGHSTGDEALIEVASILRKTFRKSDVLARIGGDEFVFLGLETEKNNPGILVERIRRKLDARNSKKTSLYPLSLSIGLVVYDPDSPVSLRDLIEEADKRMYQEKMAKKNLAQING